jgi:hypothetical protein
VAHSLKVICGNGVVKMVHKIDFLMANFGVPSIVTPPGDVRRNFASLSRAKLT